MWSLIILVSVSALLCDAREFKFENKCQQTIWVGSLGNSGQAAPENGGWKMDAGSNKAISINNGWGGRFWGRTGCNGGDNDLKCETGQCKNSVQCSGAGGVPPVTLAEFTLNGDQNQDFYDVSHVDGFNLQMAISPIAGTFQSTGGQYSCGSPTCKVDITNSVCTDEFVQKVGDKKVACYSACAKHNSDEYCCRGAFNDPNKCKASTFAKAVKNACPDAYSYAYDDRTSTYTCPSTKDVGYTITFCP